jgi:hypothetical protein
MPEPADWFDHPSSLLDAIQKGDFVRPGPPTIAGYDGVVELCRGGQGVVHTGTQTSTGRSVAIKVLFDDAETLFRQALGIRIRHLGDEHPDTAMTLFQIAEIETERGSALDRGGRREDTPSRGPRAREARHSPGIDDRREKPLTDAVHPERGQDP